MITIKIGWDATPRGSSQKLKKTIKYTVLSNYLVKQRIVIKGNSQLLEEQDERMGWTWKL